MAEYLTRNHRLLLLVAGVVFCLSLPFASQVELNWHVEGMFPPGDPNVEAYRKLQQRFGSQDLCLVVYEDAGLWEPSGVGLERLEGVSRTLKEIDGVGAVLSLAEVHDLLLQLRDPMGLRSVLSHGPPPLLDPDDKLAQSLASVFEGYTHQRESSFVAIALLLEPRQEKFEEGPLKHSATLEDIAASIESFPAPIEQGFVTGEPLLVAEGFQMVRRDGWRLGSLAATLVTIVLLLCFRSVRWTLIPLVIVGWSLWVTQACLAWLQMELTMISSTLTSMLTVIGVATTMHLLLKFQEQRRTGLSREAAITKAFEALLPPVFWACATDAVGFSALTLSDVGPVRDFGIMMALGSMVVFLAILLLVPGLALVGRRDTDPRLPKLDLVLRLRLRRLLELVLHWRKVGLSLMLGLLLWAVIGSLSLRVETDFIKNFYPSNPIVQGYSVVEGQLGGAGVWDVMLPAPRRISKSYLEQVIALEKILRAIQVTADGGSARLTKVLSIADATQAIDSGSLLSVLPISARLSGMEAAMPEFTGALVTAEPDETGYRWVRVMLRSREQAPAALKEELVQQVKQQIATFTARPDWKELFEAEPPESEVAGYHVMLGNLVSSVLKDQWTCFLLASIGIFLAVSLATRSIWYGLASLLPNALPILLVLGGMGWLGYRANMGVAMIATVSIGLSVDSSIHYLMHYRRRLAEGTASDKALRSAQEAVGLASLLATLALVVGLLSLCQSEFLPTVFFGALSSMTMTGGLLANLVLLPLLIARWARRSK